MKTLVHSWFCLGLLFYIQKHQQQTHPRIPQTLAPLTERKIIIVWAMKGKKEDTLDESIYVQQQQQKNIALLDGVWSVEESVWY